MSLPDGIDEQYMYIYNFLNNTAITNQNLIINEPFYETPSILNIALHDWEKNFGSDSTKIQYIESDTCIKRIITNKKTNVVKRIYLNVEYISGWNWKLCDKFTTVERSVL